MDKAEFGRRFKAAREATTYGQAEAARKLHMNPVRLAEYENGTVTPPLLRLAEIVDTLRMDPRILFPEWFGEKPKKSRERA